MSEEEHIEGEVALGAVTFKLPGHWNIGTDVPLNEDALPPDLLRFVESRLRAFDTRIEAQLGAPFWIDDVYLSDGTVTIRSRLITTAAVLTMLNQGYDLISKYGDFEDGVSRITARVESAANLAARAMPDAFKFKFVPADPRDIRNDLEHGRRAPKTSRPKGHGL